MNSDIYAKAAALGGLAYPHGFQWRCPYGCTYPADFKPARCPIHSQPLTRVLLSMRIGDSE